MSWQPHLALQAHFPRGATPALPKGHCWARSTVVQSALMVAKRGAILLSLHYSYPGLCWHQHVAGAGARFWSEHLPSPFTTCKDLSCRLASGSSNWAPARWNQWSLGVPVACATSSWAPEPGWSWAEENPKAPSRARWVLSTDPLHGSASTVLHGLLV